MKFTDEHGDPAFGKIIATTVIGLIALILICSSFVQIGTGERGVKTRFGTMVGSLQPGLHFKVPFVDAVSKFDVQTQKEQTDANAASADLQTVSTKVAVNYNVDPSKVTTLYTLIGQDYSSRIIDPAIQETVKAVTANYTAEQLITKRAEVTDTIQTKLKEKLIANNILVTSVSITNFDFSKSFNDAIEAKVTAEQNALGAKNLLDQKKYEAEQIIVTAQATAEAQRISSAALESTGGKNLVELEAIKKWNGVLPTQMIPGSTVPFLNINK